MLALSKVQRLLSRQQDKETFFVPEDTKKIDSFCFYGSSVKKVHIPESVEHIGDYAFAYCTSIRKITFATSSKI